MFWTRENNSKLNKLIIITLFSCVFISMINQVSTQEGESRDIFDEIHSIKIKKLEGIEKLLKESDVTFFAYYYKKTSNNSRKGAEMLKRIGEKLIYLAQILLIDCDEVEPNDTPMCKADPQAADGYPRMEIYVPPEFKFNPYTKKPNEHLRKMYTNQEVSETLIYNFITQNIPARSVKLTTENFENFASNVDLNKVILFTDKQKTPLLFRGLTNFFYDRLLFGEVYKDQTALIRKFKVTKFPTLLVYQTHEDEIPLDEPKIEYYTNEIKASAIAEFIGQYGLSEPLNLRVAREGKDSSKIRYKVVFKNLKQNDVLNYMKKFNDKRFIVYLNDEEEVPEDIKLLNKDANGFFHFINLNCKSATENFCKNTFKVTEIPSLLLFKNSEKDIQKGLEKGGISLPFDYKGIERELYKEFIGNLKEGNPQTFNSLNNEARLNKKIPFIYFHEGDIPLGLYLISSEAKYGKYIDFIVFEHPPRELVKNFKLAKLPVMIILLQEANSDQARLLTYNEDIVYSRLSIFINHYFNHERNTKIDEKDIVEDKQDISLLYDNESLKKYCINGGKKLCVLGFLDGRSNPDSIKQFDNSIKILENAYAAARKKNIPASFSWVNATCQSDLSANVNVNIESLPNLIVYVPSKNLFSNLIGTFDEESIVSFIQRVMQGRAPLNGITKEKLNLKDVKCEDINEQNDSAEDDAILKELIEAERKKREEFEKERENLENKKGKKKKKKKKSDL